MQSWSLLPCYSLRRRRPEASPVGGRHARTPSTARRRLGAASVRRSFDRSPVARSTSPGRFHGSKRAAESELSKSCSPRYRAEGCQLRTQQWVTSSKDGSPWRRPSSRPRPSGATSAFIDTHIVPCLGSIPLARLRSPQLDGFYAKLRASGGVGGRPLRRASVRQVHAIVRRAMSQGVRWGWIHTNPAAKRSPPRIRRAGSPRPTI